jgi:antitoxin (DNA-binding transcriptional repressor) of toxin-antitoxin stability system
MTATATTADLERDSSRILEQIERGGTVVIEKHGVPVCVMIPQPRKTSATELSRKLRHLQPAPEAADEMEAILNQMNDASRSSYLD